MEEEECAGGILQGEGACVVFVKGAFGESENFTHRPRVLDVFRLPEGITGHVRTETGRILLAEVGLDRCASIRIEHGRGRIGGR